MSIPAAPAEFTSCRVVKVIGAGRLGVIAVSLQRMPHAPLSRIPMNFLHTTVDQFGIWVDVEEGPEVVVFEFLDLNRSVEEAMASKSPKNPA
jgi:hypothetical protein